MEIILFLLAAIVIILCVFAGLSAQSPLFVCVAVTAMVTGLFSPLWHWMYGIVYASELVYLVGRTLPLVAFLGGWVMVLPAIVIFATLRRRLVDIGYLGMWGVAGIVFLFFWSIEGLGAQFGIWSYDNEVTALGVPVTLYLALLHTLCAVIVLRMMFEYWRVSVGTTLQIIPIIFGLQIFCYAVIGSPFYAMSLLTGASGLTAFGLICSILLILWGIHIAITSLLQIQFNTTNTAGMPIIDLAVLEELTRYQQPKPPHE
ncbi:MAG: hypothetical protein DWI30_06805 [Chloroflexi bacterium]|nr:MAG: hypothetical protein DWI30_06805 [Chloroflexota bacterium]